MLITNILLGIITFILINIVGGICDIQNKLDDDYYIKLKKFSDSLKPIIRKVEDEKKT